MRKESELKRPIVSFIILTNLIFWPLFLLVGTTLMLGLPKIVFDIMLCIASWSSTFAFILLFRKIYPGQSFTTYVKERFKNRLNFSIVTVVVCIQVLLAIVVLVIITSKNDGTSSSLTISSFGMLLYLFFTTLFAGPLGEELGWRGFALNELQKKYSPLRASVTLGFWWGIWHLPVWFTTGFIGVTLIEYIVFFMIAIISISIIITAFYNLNKNLLIPIIIHQLFNFLMVIINGNVIELLKYYAILYFVVAIMLIVLNPKKVLFGKEATKMINGHLH
ncbi:CPBP family intramembrane glutamic endopeptidase [Alkalihalobacillus pseudalcaliphilus]|uniref:CPBP family intramembrane glutamic endopeptidase n=1 Tax=Alkalihalobacillus pseudalcaliphilus TaxID=79884 RepID=UPI00064DE1C7|nr:type II CAAX endopeptidase family protein [Alkalihalobacillus pseudalcaliphilus]KMK77914.1 CAAX protease [Alkalihalobacillus pseudalcaliphilus]